ncbi:stage III sporulation protein AG [Alteribacillus iranensis]|uniref:Stage III sporulation protein AG n=1 Tax=Alteribacillus iranensis TaxID=930128 RepID=A0A1I1ZH71_9BACI|nr:stage III sporulation protein AG [Alteribacillus iranensis]SFE31005.1 stage III sporulation protein AG [Alteribacillus iranensis]
MTENNNKNFLKGLLSKKNKGSAQKTVPVYLIVILLFGIFLMIAGTIGKEKDETEKEWLRDNKNQQEIVETKATPTELEKIPDKEKAIQDRLAIMLENISGVSRVEVMVNLQGSEEKVYEKNTIFRQQTTREEEHQGGSREVEDGTKEEQIVIVRQGDQEKPILLHTKKPEARGVLVVAEGVSDLKVKEWVVEAVTRSLDVPPHKVSVLPREREEGE